MTEQSVQDLENEVAAHFGITPAIYIETDGEPFKIPNPGLLDDDQQERWEQLQFDVEQCDRDDEGVVLTPYRVDGVLVKPPYQTRLCQALFGDRYEAFKAAGGSGSQVGLIWAQMNAEYAGTPPYAAEDEDVVCRLPAAP